MMKEEKKQTGLTDKEAKVLLAEHGANRLKAKKRTSPLKIFLGQFKDLMVFILLVATAISAFLGEPTEAFAIIAIVIMNAILGFIQEYRTERTLEALKRMGAPTAQVYRDGALVQVDAEEVVPGDLVALKPGDRIPADGYLVEEYSLSCDESMLTGESIAVDKSAVRANEAGNPPSNSMVYMGTTVTKGRASAVITATGMKTQMGAIADMIEQVEEEDTPLQKRLDQLGRYIAAGCLIICFIVSVTGMLRGENPLDMLITGISLAVAAVPEGLPAIVTISLALAVRRILKRNALVKKLHAVETLGCASVICSDKTGTLTENRMVVRQLFTMEHFLSLTGGGREAQGSFLEGESNFNIASSQAVKSALEIALCCNNATVGTEKSGFTLFGRQDEELVLTGEPTETALLVMATKAGLTGTSGYTRLSEIPFDSTRKRMSVIVRRPGEDRKSFVKGAPDLILPLCNQYLSDTGIRELTQKGRKDIERALENMASQALRVIGFAMKPMEDRPGGPEDGLIFVGIAGMIDPPRKETYKAVASCKSARIRTVMITGDHAATAKAIATDLGIFKAGDRLVTGDEMDRLSDEALEALCARITVYARVSPIHKLRIVRALKHQGEIVAMTGDGVNDAPAVKEAHIGVAMGITGTDVTKEASSIILLDDNFATLVASVEEGRAIYSNIRRFIRYLISCNIGEVLTMFVGMLLGMPVVLLPIQLLLVNLITDGLPAIALGIEPAEEDVMKQAPRPAEESVLANGLMSTMMFRGVIIGLTTLLVYSSFLRMYGDLETARTGALLTLIATQLFHVFECKSEKRGLFEINLLNNPLLILAVFVSGGVSVAAVYMPILSNIFMTVPLSTQQMIFVVLSSLAAPIISSIALLMDRNKKTSRQYKGEDFEKVWITATQKGVK